jgi:hypothetical protein
MKQSIRKIVIFAINNYRMIMKFRYSAFGFVLLANIILLLHSAFPHHHYDTHIEFIHSNNDVSKQEHHSEHEGHHHHHDDVADITYNPFHEHNNDDEDDHSSCMLSTIIALPPHQLRTSVAENDIDLENTNYSFAFILSYDYELKELICGGERDVLIPPNENSYQGFNLKSNTLRGPPKIV